MRLQSQPGTIPLRYNGPIDCFRKSFQTGGVKGLYSGVNAPLVGAALETSSLFFSYHVTQELLLQTGIFTASAPLPLSALLICGAASGAFTSLLLTPVELIKCKMQVPASSLGRQKAQGSWSLIVSIFRQNGLFGFWRGQIGTLIRETGGSAAWFGSYEAVSTLFRKWSPSETRPGSSQLPVYQQMLAGAAAGVSYNFVLYPADTVKSRMQTEDVFQSASDAKRRTFWMVGKSLWKQQGLAGMYRGCGITVARSAPSSAFIFSIYEGLRYYLG